MPGLNQVLCRSSNSRSRSCGFARLTYAHAYGLRANRAIVRGHCTTCRESIPEPHATAAGSRPTYSYPLVHLADEGGEDTRQRIPLSALYSEELLNKDSGRRVLAVLTESRLVTVGIGNDRQQEVVEIAHEALVRRWPRLSQWLQEDREILVWRQRLHLIIREWQQTGRDDGFLLRGSLLDEARLWLSRRATDLTPREKEFISSSLAFNNRERSNRPIERLELLVDTSVGELDGQRCTSGGSTISKATGNVAVTD
jgi:hypothetical protein